MAAAAVVAAAGAAAGVDTEGLEAGGTNADSK